MEKIPVYTGAVRIPLAYVVQHKSKGFLFELATINTHPLQCIFVEQFIFQLL